MTTMASVFAFNTFCESLENIFKLRGAHKKTEELLKLLESYRNSESKIEDKSKNTVSYIYL